MRVKIAASLLIVIVILGCATDGNSRASAERLRGASSASLQVRALLDQQVGDWNAGNLQGFMRGYARSETTRFASGGDVLLGWQTVFERYRRKYGGDKESMGRLTFSDVDVQVLGPDNAMAFGRWRLTRQATNISGLYTLILRKTPEGWRIVHDHTSSAAP